MRGLFTPDKWSFLISRCSDKKIWTCEQILEMSTDFLPYEIHLLQFIKQVLPKPF